MPDNEGSLAKANSRSSGLFRYTLAMRNLILLSLCAAVALPAVCQFRIENSGTTASLRGIDSVGKGVAWASGTGGTILRTVDGGKHWEHCAVPPDAQKLDFRGVQAFDDKTAVVMSSGKGDLSRIYKTTDGCATWKLVFTNPDGDGFFDGLRLRVPLQVNLSRPAVRSGSVIGDPVDGKFVEFYTEDDGDHWQRQTGGQAGIPSANDGEALFAASNSSLLLTQGQGELFVTGGKAGARSRVLSEYVKHDPMVSWKYIGGDIPLSAGESAGAFAVAAGVLEVGVANTAVNDKWRLLYVSKGMLVAVGGDYKKPDRAEGTAAFSADSGLHWMKATTPPHGYRSAVAYDADSRTWITVGPNGTDVSTDDGKNWHALIPGAGDDPGADKDWNAVSLPFVVGSKGRIGLLREEGPKASSSVSR